MKRAIMSFLVVMSGFATVAEAQNGENAGKKSAIEKKNSGQGSTEAKKDRADTISLISVSANEAFNSVPARRFTIADPTINALKQQAYGITPIVSQSGVVGMPRRAYGLSNGRILLRPTTSPTSGTLYGSGAVGTGTSLMGVGSGERAIGVNGKHPRYGTWLWGSKSPVRNLPPPPRDSVWSPF